jgi:type II secretory pathway pseudopilin PulG
MAKQREKVAEVFRVVKVMMQVVNIWAVETRKKAWRKVNVKRGETLRSKICFLYPRRSHSSGLTLVELLVIVGIIAVLAGIGWVATEPVRQKALLEICRNNFRQIYLAVQQYREDYEGIEPDGRPLSFADVGLPYPFFSGLIRGGYIKDSSILHCPIGKNILKAQLAKVERIRGRHVNLINSYCYPTNLPLLHIPLLHKRIDDHFSQCVAEKRSQVAILGDPWHNPSRPPEAPITPTPLFPKWELILRLNGQIDWVLVTDGRACR